MYKNEESETDDSDAGPVSNEAAMEAEANEVQKKLKLSTQCDDGELQEVGANQQPEALQHLNAVKQTSDKTISSR